MHFPAVGLACLDELDRVPWATLDHAYGTGIVSEALNHDVPGALRALAERDPEPALSALFSNIYHQQTVYEATAYAVPFVAAVAADPKFEPRLELVNLLAAIALSSSFTTADGGMAGAFGDGTAELIRQALVKCEPALRAAGKLDPAIPPAVDSILALATADPISDALFQDARSALTELERVIEERGERPPEPVLLPTTPVRYRHPKFGEATLVRRLDNGRLALRFDDGVERVIVERFVTIVGSGSG